MGLVYGEVGSALLLTVIQASKLLAALITSTAGLKVTAGANSQWQKGGLHFGSVGLGSDTDHCIRTQEYSLPKFTRAGKCSLSLRTR